MRNCDTRVDALGVARPGGFAEYVLVPHAKYLVPIDGLDAAEAAPLACAGVTMKAVATALDIPLKSASVSADRMNTRSGSWPAARSAARWAVIS